MMTRGADILPIYFYNKPIASEDRLMRFKASVRKLKKFHSSKKWKGLIIDMEKVNEELMEVERGRMLLHREIMFRVVEKIAEEKDLEGLLTGESFGQKSSQTSSNLEMTSSSFDKPVMRPLLTRDKNSISVEAREIGNFEEAEINSACRSICPDNLATILDRERLENLREALNVEELVEKAFESRNGIEL
jgi:thiamine biosynthesis protein ThiI